MYGEPSSDKLRGALQNGMLDMSWWDMRQQMRLQHTRVSSCLAGCLLC